MLAYDDDDVGDDDHIVVVYVDPIEGVPLPCGSRTQPCLDLESAFSALWEAISHMEGPNDMLKKGQKNTRTDIVGNLILRPGRYTGEHNLPIGSHLCGSRNIRVNIIGEGRGENVILLCTDRAMDSAAVQLGGSSCVTSLVNVTISNCHKNGGVLVRAIYPQKYESVPQVALMDSVHVTNCSATRGAAVSVIGFDTSLNATSCVFESNTAILDGGAVWVTTEARANLTGCILRSNVALFGGGAAVDSGGSLYISGQSNITNNTALTSGGGVGIVLGEVNMNGGTSIHGNLALGSNSDCKGEKEDAVSALLGVGCESGWGGGISVFDGFLTLGNINGGGTILRNKVILVSMSTLTAKGGGVGALKSEVLMSGWTLEDNSAISEGPGGEMGGGVYMSNSIAEWNSLRVYNNFVGSELYLSLADSGGGGVCVEGKKMYLNAMGLDMQGNRVLPGGNGGGLWVNNGAIVNISSSIFVGNTARSSIYAKAVGGALAASMHAEVFVKHSTFSRNLAIAPTTPRQKYMPGEGGGAAISWSKLSAINVTFQDNLCKAGVDEYEYSSKGGGVLVTGHSSSAVLKFATFDHNRALGSDVDGGAGAGGGGAAVIYSLFTCEGCKFRSNVAQGGAGEGMGGALLVIHSKKDYASSTLTHCIFSHNLARGSNWLASAGGGITAVGSNLQLHKNQFLNNSVKIDTNTQIGTLPFAAGNNLNSYKQLLGGEEMRLNLMSHNLTSMNPTLGALGGGIYFKGDCSGSLVNKCDFTIHTRMKGVDNAGRAPFLWGSCIAVEASSSAGSGITSSFDQAGIRILSTTFQRSAFGEPAVDNYSAISSNQSTILDEELRPFPFQLSQLSEWSSIFLLYAGNVELNFRDGGGFLSSNMGVLIADKFTSAETLSPSNITIISPDSSNSGLQDTGSSSFSLGIMGESRSLVRLVGEGNVTMGLHHLWMCGGQLFLFPSSPQLDAPSYSDSTFSISVSGRAILGSGTLSMRSSSAAQSSMTSSVFCNGVEACLSSACSFCTSLLRGGSGREENLPQLAVEGLAISFSGHTVAKGTVTLHNGGALFVEEYSSMALKGNLQIGGNEIQSEKYLKQYALSVAGKLVIPPDSELTIVGELLLDESGVLSSALPTPLDLQGLERKQPYIPLHVRGDTALKGTLLLEGIESAGAEMNGQPIIRPHQRWLVASVTGEVDIDIGQLKQLNVYGGKGVEWAVWHVPISELRHTEIRALKLHDDNNTLLYDGRATAGMNYEEDEDMQGLYVEIKYIDCNAVTLYINRGSTGECQACLLAPGGAHDAGRCIWAGNDSEGQDGCGCVAGNSTKTSLIEELGKLCPVLRKDNCCPNNCNGLGDCDFFSGKCTCNWFYSGTSCKSISTSGALVLGIVISICAALVVIVLARHVYRKGKEEAVAGTLKDLREHLLEPRPYPSGDLEDVEETALPPFVEAGNSGERRRKSGMQQTEPNNYGMNSDMLLKYISNLQQDVILRSGIIEFSEVKLGEKIGDGATAVVLMGEWRRTTVAVKLIKPTFLSIMEEEHRESFKEEAYLLMNLRHPNIQLVMGIAVVPIEDFCHVFSSTNDKLLLEIDHTIAIVSEYMEPGSLRDVIANGGLDNVGYHLILKLALQAAKGVHFLHTHSPPICHRDLKTSNLLVDTQWHLKVIDFGLSKSMPPPIARLRHHHHHHPRHSKYSKNVHYDTLSTKEGVVDLGSIEQPPRNQTESIQSQNGNGGSPYSSSGAASGAASLGRPTSTTDSYASPNCNTAFVGTLRWAAPEILSATSDHVAYCIDVDSYSFGIIMWELWHRKLPFYDLTSSFEIVEAVKAGVRPLIDPLCPPVFASLMCRCWSQDPGSRPGFETILHEIGNEKYRIESQSDSGFL